MGECISVTNIPCLYEMPDGRCGCTEALYFGPCKMNCGDECAFYKLVRDDEHNAVEHPNHYCQGGIECIKAIEASMSPEGFQDYCKGNIMKYIWRFREKNGLEDLKKAQVYLGWMIESVEKQETANGD